MYKLIRADSGGGALSASSAGKRSKGEFAAPKSMRQKSNACFQLPGIKGVRSETTASYHTRSLKLQRFVSQQGKGRRLQSPFTTGTPDSLASSVACWSIRSDPLTSGSRPLVSTSLFYLDPDTTTPHSH